MIEMVLLGAGASIEADVPGAYKMTERMVSDFHKDAQLQKYAPVLSFVTGGLLFQQGIRGNDPYGGVDVEELFNAVQLLEGRSNLEAAPFIGSWHPLVAEFDRINPPRPSLNRLNRIIYESVTDQILKAFPAKAPGFSDKHIDEAINNAIVTTVQATQKGRTPKIPSWKRVSKSIEEYVMGVTGKWLDNLKRSKPSSNRAFEREFSKAVAGQQPEPGEGEIFHETNDSMIRNLVKIVWIDRPGRVEYLSPLLRLAQAQGNLVVATLNYDNGVEVLAGSHGERVDTGIVGWSETGTFDFGGEGLHLLKLHGSIDWALADGPTSPERPMPHKIIRRVREDEIGEAGFRPAVIFGQRNKLTAEGPFLDLLGAFRSSLAESDRLTIVGYSFRDPHINEYLSLWLNEDTNHRMRIVDPYFGSNRQPYVEVIRTYGRDRVEIVSEEAGVGLSRLF